ncbi:MAG TPA: ATP-binding protein [Gemmataceae bacterium]|nr:ATP-binding protein [Gemmataceae bacterium]
MSLSRFTADHRSLVDAAARVSGIDDPVAIELDEFKMAVLDKAIRGPFFPIDGVFIRNWDRSASRYWPGAQFGIRLYTLEGIPLARCVAEYDTTLEGSPFTFFIVARANYINFFRTAVRLKRASAPPTLPPILPEAILNTLHRNTIGYLRRDNLSRIRELGGRPRRGLLLSGPPGNGKTSACRWLWEECHRLRFEYRIVSPDMYQAARRSCNPVEAVKELFSVSRRGIVFFDDMDVALRDRALAPESDDQAVFLGAMDGIEIREGVVYVFTTNCPVDLIDPAFKRPGRIDLVLQFDVPTADLRRRLIERWHEEIRAGIDIERAVAATDGWSFAEVDEMKNLLILLHLETGTWDWEAARDQWEANRHDLSPDRKRGVGFHLNGRATTQ